MIKRQYQYICQIQDTYQDWHEKIKAATGKEKQELSAYLAGYQQLVDAGVKEPLKDKNSQSYQKSAGGKMDPAKAEKIEKIRKNLIPNLRSKRMFKILAKELGVDNIEDYYKKLDLDAKGKDEVLYQNLINELEPMLKDKLGIDGYYKLLNKRSRFGLGFMGLEQ